ncbi:MAG: phage tail protein [Halobacteriales archaeon]|nr:phage tail protein [Halobacteriales archaeon]
MSRTYADEGWGINRRTVMQLLGIAGLTAAFSGSASAQQVSPPRTNRFLVEIAGIEISGFSRVEMPDAVIGEVPYREGNMPPSARKLSGLNELDTLVLEKGVNTDSLSLYQWFKNVQDDGAELHKRSLSVVLLDARGDEVARWNFFEAWPARYEAPDLDARSSEVAVERLEVVVEQMERA